MRRIRQWVGVGLAVVLAVGSTGAERPLDDYPAAARERFQKGMALQKEGRFPDAVKEFDEAIRLGMHDYPRLLVERAECLRKEEPAQAVVEHTRFLDDVGRKKPCRL